MAFDWTPRQFVAGTVALDWANTVCYRGDPGRRFDKILSPDDLQAFQAAAVRLSDAAVWCGEGDGPNESAPVNLALCREIRETTDALFRPVPVATGANTVQFQRLLRIYCDLLAGQRLRTGADGVEIDPVGAPSFALALTQSAMRLAHSTEIGRIRTCPNCDWLFIDRSRNGSRVWCDMLTCGNREKARRHQSRRRNITGKQPNGGQA